jgi:hypothetical protein
LIFGMRAFVDRHPVPPRHDPVPKSV